MSAVMRGAIAFAIVACSSKPAPPPPPPRVAEPTRAQPPRRDVAVPTPPVTLAIARDTLVWTDIAGAIYAMPVDGSRPPRELSNQHAPSFAFRVVRVGDRVFASTHKDLLEVALPDGRVTALGLDLAENPEQVVADERSVYVTLFKRDVILRIDPIRRAAERIADVPRGVLAVHGGQLYVASYATGKLVTLPTAGGAHAPVARGLERPTALAADDQFAFVYTEHDRALHRIALANGANVELARDLVNSDRVVSDGAWVYTLSRARPGKLVRVAKSGSGEPEVLAGDLAAPSAIVVERDAIWVTSRDQSKLVRIDKAALAR